MAFAFGGGTRDNVMWDAVSNRDLPEVRRLLAGGCDPNMLCPDSLVAPGLCQSEKFRSGQTADTGRSLLHHAAWAGDVEIFKTIVEAGGDIDKKRVTVWRPNGGVNGRGNKPLHFAVMYNRRPIVEYLLSIGADVNAAGDQGYTPLHISVKFNYQELMELLLRSGARTDMITRDEKTARDLAKWGGENTTEAMGDCLALFDRCEAACKAAGAAAGQSSVPGAPLRALEPWMDSAGGVVQQRQQPERQRQPESARHRGQQQQQQPEERWQERPKQPPQQPQQQPQFRSQQEQSGKRQSKATTKGPESTRPW